MYSYSAHHQVNMFECVEQQSYSNRQSPDTCSSDGMGSSLSVSPAPSSSDSSLYTSPVKFNYNSTPQCLQPSYSYYSGQQHGEMPLYGRPQQLTEFNDSNYYSRNNSHCYEMNESFNINKMNSTRPQPLNKIDSLKFFSIEAILARPCNTKTTQPAVCVSPDAQCETVEAEQPKEKLKRKKRVANDAPVQQKDNKRLRTIFTQEQLDKLEVEFLKQQYMVGSERTYLASSLGLTESQVKIWFQNRRIKWRKTSADENASVSAVSAFNSSHIASASLDQSYDDYED